jgi:hypothetical protein
VRFVELLARAVAREPVFRRSSEPSPSWVADIGRLRRTLGEPTIGVEEGVEREWSSGA